MPKKFQGENTKAVAARQRKNANKEAQVSQKQKELEDAYWKDDDKHVIRKQQKKEEEQRKKQEQLLKKAEAKALFEKEQASLSKISAKAPTTSKITRAQISEKVSQQEVPKKEKVETHLDVPLEENINRLTIDGAEARTIEEAIKVLGGNDEIDKHPEKRMKAAYKAFEEKRLAELKIENPTLRMSQLKQLIFKEWQKSPENPLNNV